MGASPCLGRQNTARACRAETNRTELESSMLHAVIMAGGSGTRFWPQSRVSRPKQLLNLLGDRTMIQATVDRVSGLVPPERLLIATTSQLAAAVAEQLPQLRAEAIIAEPCPRDTAPCIGLAATLVAQKDPDATLIVLPSDHVISPPRNFAGRSALPQSWSKSGPGRLSRSGCGRPIRPKALAISSEVRNCPPAMRPIRWLFARCDFVRSPTPPRPGSTWSKVIFCGTRASSSGKRPRFARR